MPITIMKKLPVPIGADPAALNKLGSLCAEEKYPVSGEDCGPEDPVKSLDASDCNPGPLATGF